MKERKKSAERMERKPNWKEYTATVEDIQNFLMDRILLRHNVITGRVECRIPEKDLWESEKRKVISEKLSQQWVPISDRIVNSLWAELSATKVVNIRHVWQVIESDFVPEFNPFTFYLDRLPPWNGRDDYLLELSLSVNVKGGAEEQLLFGECLRKWFVAMVAGWIHPKVVNHEILIFIGEQGSYKTTWFDYLLPPELHEYFRIKTNAAHMTKDDLIVLSQYGLVCYEELDTMRPSELNQLKSAVTAPSVDERKPYGRFTEHRPHIASFCGTGNNTQFLTDTTGNRRWLPFEVQSIMSPRDVPFNYEGIYSQAYALYRQGFQYWFSQQEIQQLSAHVRQFETPRLEAELVDVYFRLPVGVESGEFMPVSRALQIVGGNMTHQLSAIRLGRAFTDLGFEFRRTKSSRGYIVVQRSAEEIRARLRGMAGDG